MTISWTNGFAIFSLFLIAAASVTNASAHISGFDPGVAPASVQSGTATLPDGEQTEILNRQQCEEQRRPDESCPEGYSLFIQTAGPLPVNSQTRYTILSDGAQLSGTATVMASGALVGTPAQAARRGQRLETITTQSRKRARAEVAQGVPIASTIVTDTMIDLNHYVDLRDIARMVPNSDFRETATFPGVQRFWLRGHGVNFSVPNFDPVVGVVMDGVFVAQNIAANLDTFDMESVEVLRGPQGTLFGRNLANGAVLTRSRRPGDELSIRGKAVYGRFDRADFAFSVGGPIIEDRLAGKIAFQYRSHNGYIRNNSDPDGRNEGQLETFHVKPIFVFTPSDSFDFTLIGEYYARRGDGAPTVTFPPGPNLENVQNPLLKSLTGQDTRAWRETWAEEDLFPSFSDHDVFKVIGEANWDLGHGVLTSVTGYIDVDSLSGTQFDGLPNINISTTRIWVKQDQFSQELRYASAFSETWGFTFGLFYFDQHLIYGEQRMQDSRIGLDVPRTDPGNPLGLGFAGHDILDHKEYAAFLDVHVDITDRLTLTLGGRYSHEKKDVRVGLVNSGSCVSSGQPAEGLRVFDCLFGPADGFDFEDQESWNNFLPRVVLDYRVNDDVLVYASWSRGFRSGGWSFRASPAELTNPDRRPGFYDRERVDSFEIGLKGDFFDNRLRTNITTFYSLWKGIQRNLQFSSEGGGNIFQTTLNAPESFVWGIEAEINAIVAEDALTAGDSLRFDTAIGWFDSGYNDFVDFEPDGIDDRDRPFPAPEFTLFVGLTYEHPVGNSGSYLTFRASYRYTSQWMTGSTDTNLLDLYGNRDLLDASIRFDSGDGRWYASVFGRNLLDDQIYETRVTFAPNSFGVAVPSMPATWGIEIGFNF